MTSSKWNKLWLYDCAIKVPKTTRWRRKLEYGSPVPEDANDAVQGEFSSVIEGLRNNTSPLKRQKIFDDCLIDDNNEDQFTYNDGSQTTPTANFNSTVEKCHEYELIEDDHHRLVDCKGE